MATSCLNYYNIELEVGDVWSEWTGWEDSKGWMSHCLWCTERKHGGRTVDVLFTVQASHRKSSNQTAIREESEIKHVLNVCCWWKKTYTTSCTKSEKYWAQKFILDLCQEKITFSVDLLAFSWAFAQTSGSSCEPDWSQLPSCDLKFCHMTAGGRTRPEYVPNLNHVMWLKALKKL